MLERLLPTRPWYNASYARVRPPRIPSPDSSGRGSPSRAVSLIAVLGLALSAASPARAHAPSTTAGSSADEAPYQRARRHFADKEYLAAARALDEAYQLDPNADYLYQRGHALRLAGSCAAALPVFREVETLVQTEVQQEEVRRWIAHCERVVAEVAEVPEVPEVPETSTVPPPEPPSTSPVAQPIPSPTAPRNDVAAGATMGIGGALVLVGSGLLIGASVVANRDDAGESEPAYERRRDQVRSLEISGAVVVGIGVAAVVAASIRYGILQRRQRKSSAWRVGPGGLTGRF